MVIQKLGFCHHALPVGFVIGPCKEGPVPRITFLTRSRAFLALNNLEKKVTIASRTTLQWRAAHSTAHGGRCISQRAWDPATERIVPPKLCICGHFGIAEKTSNIFCLMAATLTPEPSSPIWYTSAALNSDDSEADIAAVWDHSGIATWQRTTPSFTRTRSLMQRSTPVSPALPSSGGICVGATITTSATTATITGWFVFELRLCSVFCPDLKAPSLWKGNSPATAYARARSKSQTPNTRYESKPIEERISCGILARSVCNFTRQASQNVRAAVAGEPVARYKKLVRVVSTPTAHCSVHLLGLHRCYFFLGFLWLT